VARTRTRAADLGSAISLATLEKVHVKSVLESVRWNERRAAKILGISAKTLSTGIKSYNLNKPG
jgi:DNA-binding protein Fis